MIARLAVVVAVVVVATIVGRWWQSRQGRVRTIDAEATASVDEVATPEGTDAASTVRSAVLVSTPSCRWCPQVRDALDRVAAAADGFRWTEVDASRDLAFVRDHDVRRAPTVLFRDRDDRVVARASGPMTAAQVAEAVGTALPLPVA